MRHKLHRIHICSSNSDVVASVNGGTECGLWTIIQNVVVRIIYTSWSIVKLRSWIVSTTPFLDHWWLVVQNTSFYNVNVFPNQTVPQCQACWTAFTRVLNGRKYNSWSNVVCCVISVIHAVHAIAKKMHHQTVYWICSENLDTLLRRYASCPRASQLPCILLSNFTRTIFFFKMGRWSCHKSKHSFGTVPMLAWSIMNQCHESLSSTTDEIHHSQ